MAEPDPQPSDDELISAYCDGELTGDELARAEHLLASRPEFRQLLEEYRALRARLHEVPHRALGNDFAGRVLRRAEREVLVTAAAGEPIAEPAPGKTGWHLPTGRRPWVYVGAAMAAAIVIMLFEPEQGGHEKLAERAPLPHRAEISAPPATVAGGDPQRKFVAARDANRDRNKSVQLQAEPPGLASPGARHAVAKSPADSPNDAGVKRALSQIGWAGIADAAAGQAASIEQNYGLPVHRADVLVVECSIDWQGRTADPMIAAFRENRIAIDENPRKLNRPLARNDSAGKPGSAPKAGGRQSEPEDTDAVAIYFVVATPQQLESTLSDLGTRPGVSWRLLSDSPNEKQKDSSGVESRLGENPAAEVDKLASKKEKEQRSQLGRAQRLVVGSDLRRLAEKVPPSTAVATEEKSSLGATQKVPASSSPPDEDDCRRALFIVRKSSGK